MGDYAKTVKRDDRVDVYFYNEMTKPLAIGEKMYAINKEAYMNGYNWDAFFNYYLAKYAPDVAVKLDSDPEAGSYMAMYPLTPENEVRAEKFVKIITELIENEEELYRIGREEGDEIEWD